MQSTIEQKKSRTVEEVGSRMLLQREFLKILIGEGIFNEDELATQEGMERFQNISRQVSDIIDSNDVQFESVRSAFLSGDYDAAAKMIRQYINL